MNNIIILQVDNRPNYDTLIATRSVNEHMCSYFKNLPAIYKFKNLNDISNEMLIDKQPGDRRGWNTKYKKIFALQQALDKYHGDIIIFLDSDAWIQNPYYIEQLIFNLNKNKNIIGAFSRDPYIESNTYVNSGSFIIKSMPASIEMYRTIVNNYLTKPKSGHKHKNHIKFHDQYFVSEYVEKNKELFKIYQPHVLNTPEGEVLRHYWFNKRDDNEFNKQINDILKADKFPTKEYNFDKFLDQTGE